MTREAIFISHATPEDNGFVRWLGARLELAGFRVWHDLDRLKGGDHFWDKIEKAIREESFRFLAVVSKVSVGMLTTRWTTTSTTAARTWTSTTPMRGAPRESAWRMDGSSMSSSRRPSATRWTSFKS